MGPWGAAGPLGGASAMRPRSPVSLPAGPLAGGLVHDLSCVAAILLLELQESKVRGSVATAGSAGHTLGQGPPHLPWDELWAPAMLPGMPGNVSAPPRSVVSDCPQGPAPQGPSRHPPPPPAGHLVVLPWGHSGFLGQGRLLGPAAGGSAGLAGLLLARCPHGPGQQVVLPPQLPEAHTFHLQRLLQLQGPHLQPRTAAQQAGPRPRERGLHRSRGGAEQDRKGRWEGSYLGLHLLLLQLDEGEAGEVHGVCGQSGVGQCLRAFPTPAPPHGDASAHLCLRPALGPTWWRPPRWRPSR